MNLLQRHWPALYDAGMIKIVGRPATADDFDGKRLTPEAVERTRERARRRYHDKVKNK